MTVKARFIPYPHPAKTEARAISTKKRAKIGKQIAEIAHATAPVLHNVYAPSFSVRVSGTQVFVESSDDTAIHKEYGTSDTPAHASLTNAAMQFGIYHGTMPR